jgi:hypothetical protein
MCFKTTPPPPFLECGIWKRFAAVSEGAVVVVLVLVVDVDVVGDGAGAEAVEAPPAAACDAILSLLCSRLVLTQ